MDLATAFLIIFFIIAVGVSAYIFYMIPEWKKQSKAKSGGTTVSDLNKQEIAKREKEILDKFHEIERLKKQ